MIASSVSELKESRYQYLAAGWHLFPVCWFDDKNQCACGHKDIDGKPDPHTDNNIGKAPIAGHGLKDATTTRAGVDEYIRKYPHANWAGWFPGMFILDIDKNHGGYESFEKLEAKIGKLPKTRTHVTGSGGLHIIFKQPEGYHIGNTVHLAGYEGIDRRGNGGYIVLPPSFHVSGGIYDVIDDSPIIEAPKELLELQGDEIKSGEAHAIPADIPEGMRNQTLLSLAGSMRRRGLAVPVIEAALREVNRAQCKPPLSDNEVHSISESIGRYEPKTDKHNGNGKKEIFDWHAKAITHAELLKTEDKKQEYIIEGFMPKSCYALLGAKPKLGKSILASQLAQNAASGTDFLGMHVKKTTVVYMQLENGGKRERSRLAMQHSEIPLPIIYFFEWEYLNTESGQKAIIEMLKEYKPGLLIIDTLSRAINAKLDQNDAGQAAEIGYFIQKLSVDFDMAIWVIHHHGKMATGDPGLDLRGSIAFAQSADLLIGMYKNQDGTCNLRTSARDTDEVDLRIKLDKEVTWAWVNLGEDKDIRLIEAKKKIHEALDAIGEANARDIAEEIGVSRVAIQNHLKPMRMNGELEYRVNPHKRGEILYKNPLT